MYVYEMTTNQGVHVTRSRWTKIITHCDNIVWHDTTRGPAPTIGNKIDVVMCYGSYYTKFNPNRGA